MAVALAKTTAFPMNALLVVVALSASMMAPRVGRAQEATTRPGAIEALQDALLINANAPEDWYALGRALYAENRDRESIAAFERAMQFGTVHAHDAPWRIARAYARIGNRRQALRWAEHSIASGASSKHQMQEAAEFAAYRRDPKFRQLMEGTHLSNTSADGMTITRVDMSSEK